MKTAAVIGANSMLGSHLTSSLLSMGVEVLLIGRNEKADIRLDLEKGFLTSLPDNARADVIFHCAASYADDSNEGIRKNFQVNTAGCLWVLALAEHLDCKTIIYAGTVSSLETLDPNRYTSYGFTKAQAEGILDWGMKRLNRRFCSLRFSQIYDTAGTCIHHQPWLGRIIAYASRGLDISMPRSEGVRNFLHLDDVVRMMVSVGQSTVKGMFNIVHSENLTYQQIALLAYNIFGKGGRILTDPNKVAFRHINYPNSTQVFRDLGMEPTILIAEGIARIRDQGTWTAFGPLDVT
jgi:nucleoside-diphosphate-sugar epimerase